MFFQKIKKNYMMVSLPMKTTNADQMQYFNDGDQTCGLTNTPPSPGIMVRTSFKEHIKKFTA
jgi:hypothetical protein